MTKRQQASPEDQPKSRRKLLLAASLIFIAAAAVAASQLSSKPTQASLQALQQNLPAQSWMIIGAYADYRGQVSAVNVPVNISGKIQVIDLNATHALIQTDMSISTTFAPPIKDRTFQWINKKDVVFQPKGEILARTYDSQVDVAGLGSRRCTIFDYTADGINATYYLDRTLQWPIRIVYNVAFENQTYELALNLTYTNIAGL